MRAELLLHARTTLQMLLPKTKAARCLAVRPVAAGALARGDVN